MAKVYGCSHIATHRSHSRRREPGRRWRLPRSRVLMLLLPKPLAPK